LKPPGSNLSTQKSRIAGELTAWLDLNELALETLTSSAQVSDCAGRAGSYPAD
jgi:hypothetical protein